MSTLFYVPLLILFAVASEGSTQITFPYLAEDNLMAFGDAAYNYANRSFIINTGDSLSRGSSCGALMYAHKVRIQDAATGRAASFSTSFSFAINSTTSTVDTPWDDLSSRRDGSAFTIAFLKSVYFPTMGGFTSELGQSGRCKSYRPALNTSLIPISFDVTFGTEYKVNHNMTSRKYIRVGKNDDDTYDVSAYTHNLCGSDDDSDCDYFSKGGLFTAWIDFNSSSHTLEVGLASGSNSSVMKKPLHPLLLIPHYEGPKGIGDDAYITFWGGSDVHHVESHELLSWSFFSSSGGSESNISSTRSSLLHVLKVGISIGVLEVVALVVVLWSIFRYARSSRYPAYSALKCAARPSEYSYAELRKATGNFDDRNLLGTGGSGSVYRGTLQCPNGERTVAAKQISLSEYCKQVAASVLHAEVVTLGRIRHRNVVKLYGWCQEKARMSFIYDCKPNGGLNELWLHRNGSHFQCPVLRLKLRQSILECLHEDCQICNLHHQDIKFNNVLLDANFKAYLGDFGLACLMGDHKLDKSTFTIGTLGYMTLEMPCTSKATLKVSDVYSFGILVLEVVSGRCLLDMQAVELEDLVLLYFVWRAHEAMALSNVVDSRLFQTCEPSRSITLQNDESINTMNTISRVVDVNIEVHKSMIVNLLHLGHLCLSRRD